MNQPVQPTSISGNGARARVLPLSAAAHSVWFSQRVSGDAPISVAQYVDIRGALDIDLLMDSARWAGREFGAGRLHVFEVDGHPYQTLAAADDDFVVQVDFRGRVNPLAAAREWMREEHSRPVDLSADQLIVAAVLRISEEHTFWYVRAHQVALDAHGLRTLIERSAELYTHAFVGAAASPSGALDLEAVAASDASYRTSERFERDRDSWAEHLAGVADPVTFAGTAAPSQSEPVVIGGELAPAAPGASLSAPTVVAAFGAFLAQHTGRDEVTVTLPTPARGNAALRRSGGSLANVVPLRLSAGAGMTVGEASTAAGRELAGALSRQRHRQEDIAREVGVIGDRAASFGPTIELMLADSEIPLGPLDGALHVLTTGRVDDLTVRVRPGAVEGATRIDFLANRDLYSVTELRQLHQRFLAFVEGFLAADSDSPLSAVA
ncbi:condensation domain-containing protein [Rhodococcus maanshanensis]|uniref:Condensation domain-containing protein n=1 Tax=Rhodococcus maanshanensis TaxID=183556 RepID=A0A1H7G3C9_9NOCA|nr:condensation domain-containing protein [Rhodococcus maanshanensis]SEK32554.1 Condensation domain-containing protein [Rhodococcus maanshanensis]